MTFSYCTQFPLNSQSLLIMNIRWSTRSLDDTAFIAKLSSVRK